MKKALLCCLIFFVFTLFFACFRSAVASPASSCRSKHVPSPGVKPRPVIPPPHIDKAIFPCLDWKKHVSWPLQSGKIVPYRIWQPSMRARLNSFFHAFVTDTAMPSMNCPDPTVSLYYMTASQALDIYLAHVAHALALEYTRKLPWRLYQLPREEIAEILGSSSYLSTIPTGYTSIHYPSGMGPGQGYRLPFRQSQAAAFVCDPRVGYRFMRGQWPGQQDDLLGASKEATLKNLSAWFRDEVSHGIYNETIIRNHALLKDRLVRYQEPTIGKISYWATFGCHSATNTMADLARSVNIPLLRVGSRDSGNNDPTVSHGALIFRWARTNPLVLVHLDDLYTQDYDWIVFPVTSTTQASPSEKDWRFFRANWVSPQQLQQFGFEYALGKVQASSQASCTSSMRCDFHDYGWHIGGWRKGTRENPNQKIAQQQWLTYFDTVKDRVMSDGKPCYDSQTFSWHPECIAEVQLAHSKIYGYYYANELNRGYRLSKNAGLGAYTLIRNHCDFPGGNFNWQSYVQDEQGQPSPLNHSWQYYRDQAQNIVNLYGGCQNISTGMHNAVTYKFRP